MNSSLNDVLYKATSRSIKAVRYYEIPYETAEPMWKRTADLDSVDLGVELEFDSGEMTSFTWTKLPVQYSLTAFDGRYLANYPVARQWEVSNTPNWMSVIGQRIQYVSVTWMTTQVRGEVETKYPQSALIRFEGGSTIVISVCEYVSADKSLIPMADNLVVVFGEDLAQNLSVL